MLRIAWNQESLDIRDKLSFQILDLAGRTLIRGSLRTLDIDVSMLSSGVYTIILQTPDRIVNQKFLKE